MSSHTWRRTVWKLSSQWLRSLSVPPRGVMFLMRTWLQHWGSDFAVVVPFTSVWWHLTFSLAILYASSIPCLHFFEYSWRLLFTDPKFKLKSMPMGYLSDRPYRRYNGDNPVTSQVVQLYAYSSVFRYSFQFDFCLSVSALSICINVLLNCSTCPFPCGW